MANEQAQQILKKLDKNLDLIVLGILVLLLLGVLKIKSDESALNVEVVQTIPRAELKDVLPSENSQSVKDLFSGPETIEQDERFRSLITFNIFQVLSAQDREAIEQRANARYQEAQRLFADENFAEARRIAQEILAELPSHRNARLLLARIEGAQSAGETEEE